MGVTDVTEGVTGMMMKFEDNLLAAEAKMNKKWGHYAWKRLCSPGMAEKYDRLRKQWFESKSVELADNLIKGLKMIDAEISESHKPDDYFYLYAKGEDHDYYFVADRFDQERVTAKMGKKSIVFTLEEVVEVMEAKSLADIRKIKAEFPTSRLQNVQFNHSPETTEDEVPF